MYPIHSTLRRLASTVIYLEDGRALKSDPRIQQLDFESSCWVKKLGKKVQVFELSVEAATPALAARKLSLKENEIASAIKAEDQRYTLIFGPEGQEDTPNGVRRVVRLAALNGIFRYSAGVVKRLRQPRGVAGRSSRRRAPPQGVSVERR